MPENAWPMYTRSQRHPGRGRRDGGARLGPAVCEAELSFKRSQAVEANPLSAARPPARCANAARVVPGD